MIQISFFFELIFIIRRDTDQQPVPSFSWDIIVWFLFDNYKKIE
jgi:hypothetical protein